MEFEVYNIDDEIKEYMQDPGYVLMEMEEVRAKKATILDLPCDIFMVCGFDYLRKYHGPLLKILWNGNKFENYACNGYIEINSGNYVESKLNPYTPSQEQLNHLRKIINELKPLFLSVWEGILYITDVADYIRGRLSFHDLVTHFEDIDDVYISELSKCETLKELENKLIEYKLIEE